MQTVQQLFDLSGKVAIVTGAGSGLGVVFAGALAEAGATVVCADSTWPPRSRQPTASGRRVMRRSRWRWMSPTRRWLTSWWHARSRATSASTSWSTTPV